MMAVLPRSHPGRHTSGQYYNAGAVATTLIQFLYRYCDEYEYYTIFREIVAPTNIFTVSGKYNQLYTVSKTSCL